MIRMLEIDDYKISLDKKEPNTNMDFISHAHSDHISAVKSSQTILTSDPTSNLIQTVYNINKIEMNRIKVPSNMYLINSGHMLGSKQLVITNETKGEKIIYSGDFQLQKSRTAPAIDVEDTDILILDSTYPYPNIEFDSRESSEYELQKWVRKQIEKGIILFGSYIMGKSQEIIKILNEIGICPVVSKEIKLVSDIYKDQGVKLDYVSMYDDVEECESIMKNNFVGITSNNNMRKLNIKISRIHEKPLFTAVATGFSRIFNFNTDAQFCISDHADIKQSIDYINLTNAKKVFTYGKEAKLFAKIIKDKGFNAIPLST